MFTATYSPEDNKLRLYASTRLDAETYQRVKAAGFIWAPKQDLFVAPMWTPEREDLLIELAGEVGDEDTSLVDRAEERSERFENYSEKRATDAHNARESVNRIADGIPFGQPILVGHHSERHARKDAEKIENGMRRAVRMWECSNYWTARAAGAIRHAAYKERPDVRARRIKTIEADRRRMERQLAQSADSVRVWAILDNDAAWKPKEDGTMRTRQERACYIAGRMRNNITMARVQSTYANGQPWERTFTAYDVLRPDGERPQDCPSMAPEEIISRYERAHEWMKTRAARWFAHYDNRLAYERAMLAESGYTPPPKPKTSAALPLLNYAGPVAYRNPYHRGEIIRGEAHPMTRAEWTATANDYKGTRVSECGTHRVRTGYLNTGTRRELVAVVLTDAKQHPKPAPEQIAARSEEENADKLEASINAATRRLENPPKPKDERAQAFDAMRQSLKAGVQVVSAPQLFPTPPEIARRMVELADIEPSQRVLEPSAGTGRLIDALGITPHELGPSYDPSAEPTTIAVEQNHALAEGLRQRYRGLDIRCADFLACNGDLGTFDRIVMNPPFENGADIRHILHARKFLRPGGKLVALCANGPRQQAQLQSIADSWEELPEGSFQAQGTGVRVAMLTLDAEVTE